MVETRGLRSAFAVAQLLSSLAVGGVEDRLNALRSLRLEVIDAAQGPMPKNTARVLLQIMKELVRAFGDRRRQLELAHEFRTTFSGKPRIVRRQLRHYHLLEMPEEWNQIAFDDHVHDVNTKGRKSSTHLLMDAWIKGIRRLRIIHYNFMEPRFAAELFAAARILDIDVRIGIEFSARFRDTFVQLIWVPRGFADAQSFLCFLAEPPVMRLMEAGRRASLYQQEYVIALLHKFNAVHRAGPQRAPGHRARAGRPGRVPRLRRHRPEIQAAPVQVHLRQGAESPAGAHLRFRAGAGNGRGGPAPRSLGVARAHERHGPRGADRRLSRAAAQPRDRLPRPPGRLAGRPRTAAPLAPGDARPPGRAARRLPGDPEPHEPEGRGGPGAALRLPGDDHAAGDLQPEGLLRRQDGPRGRDRHSDAGDQRGQRHPPEAGHPRDHRTRAGDRSARADREAQGHPLRHRRPQVLLRGPAAQVAHRQRLDGPLRAFSRHGARYPGDPAGARAARDRARPQGRGPRDHPGADDGPEDPDPSAGGGRLELCAAGSRPGRSASCSTRTG